MAACSGPATMQRVLLTTVFRPFCIEGPYDSAQHQVQHGSCHRQFTREQGIFTIHQQCSHLGLHLIAANLDAEVEVVEYPSLEELEGMLRAAVTAGRPYDWVGIGTVAAYLPKARVICERVRALSPTTRTVVGGGGALAIGELVERFSDEVCPGDGVAFFRRLLHQDAGAPIRSPAIWSVHFPNEIFSFRANSAAWSMALALGCERRCPFCSTSAQFGGKRIRLYRSGAEIMDAIRGIETRYGGPGDAPPALQLMFFDENFLSDDELAREFLAQNRQALAQGKLYLPFVFADANAVQRFTPEELLEMGIDSLWIGMETADGGGYAKNQGVDFPALVEELQSHGIKVIVSFLAGRDDQTADSVRRDVDAALELGAAAFQYAMVAPMPGTATFDELRSQGRLRLERLDHIGMSHYIVEHSEFDEPGLRAHTIDFHRKDYERHGPMSLRYLKLRLSGYKRHRDSDSAALRTRARGFRQDLMDSLPALSTGIVFSPTPALRRESRELLRELGREIPRERAFAEWRRGEISTSSFGRFLLFTSPVTEPLLRQWLRARILRWDPRTRERCATPWGLLRHGSRCAEVASQGMMPFEQPVMVVTRYPEERQEGPVPAPAGLARRAWRRVLGRLPLRQGAHA